MTTIIPPMTDPLGVHWRQPNPDTFAIDHVMVLMTIWDLNALHDYSSTIPTGVYVGKMWRRRTIDEHGVHGWLLCWYDVSEEPGHCSIKSRKVVVV